MKGFYDLRKKKESVEIIDTIVSHLITRISDRDIRRLLRRSGDLSGFGFEDLEQQLIDSKSAFDYFVVRQIHALFEKNIDCGSALPAGERRARAILKFLASEEQCRSTNQRFRTHSTGGDCPGIASIIHRMQCIISDVLGPVPSIGRLKMRFGPGASANVRKKTSARHKLSATPECSREFNELLPLMEGLHPHWLLGTTISNATGELTTVPKNAEIDRCIIIEPTLNTYVQVGVGSYIKDCLLKVGIDLRDQAVNRLLARLGSIGNELATLDLSSASDLIASYLILLLFPLPWAEFLISLRTGTVHIDIKGRRHLIELEKFSSMGNGFTFELESLIFYAISRAALEEAHLDHLLPSLSVFGDDIIVPTVIVERVAQLLRHFGFTLNEKKSCTKANHFRESCGGDFLNGTPVRPFYLKDRMTSARICALVNHLLGSNFPTLGYEVFALVRPYLPKQHVIFGPRNRGSGHFHTAFLKKTLALRKKQKGWSGWTFSTYVQTPRKDKSELFNPLTRRSDMNYLLYSQYLAPNKDDPELTKLPDRDPYVIRGSYKEKKISIYEIDEPALHYHVLLPEEKAIRRHIKRTSYLRRRGINTRPEMVV